MTNVGRAGGKGAAALTFAGDVLKGLVPILIGKALNVSPGGLALIALATLLGAIYSIFLGFSGGRGVAAALGIWLGLAPTSVAPILFDFSGGAGAVPDRLSRFDQRRAGFADSGRAEFQ